MLGHVLLFLALGAQAQAQPPAEQTVQVRRGTRLEVHNFLGDVSIKAWDKDSIKVESDAGRQPVEIRSAGNVVFVRPAPGTRVMRPLDVEISIPSWMAIIVSSVSSDVTIEGAGADVSVETMRGNVVLHGGSGFVSTKSFQGRVTIANAKGRIEAEGVNQSIRLTDVSGDVKVGTVNGNVTLERVETSNLDVSSVNGGIIYDGPIRDRGSYRLTTHNGTVALAIEQKSNATIRVRTYSGSFRSSFPVTIGEENRQNRFTLTLGDGSARVELESFNGSISLVRPGEPMPERDRVRTPSPRPTPAPAPAPPARPAPPAPSAPPAPPR